MTTVQQSLVPFTKDTVMQCVCGTCPVFNEGYHLADNHPGGYFCKGGQAA